MPKEGPGIQEKERSTSGEHPARVDHLLKDTRDIPVQLAQSRKLLVIVHHTVVHCAGTRLWLSKLIQIVVLDAAFKMRFVFVLQAIQGLFVAWTIRCGRHKKTVRKGEMGSKTRLKGKKTGRERSRLLFGRHSVQPRKKSSFVCLVSKTVLCSGHERGGFCTGAAASQCVTPRGVRQFGGL